MKKNEKLMIGVLILITIAMIGVLAFSKSETWKKTLNTNIQGAEKGQNIIDDTNEDYSLEKATESGYFVIGHNKVYNKEKLDKFIENTSINSKNRREDSIKIIQYTTEGDPIITELIYKKTENTSTYILKEDNTRDKWSAEEDRKVRINEDIPGNIYGITEREEGNTVIVELALYAEIDYADEKAKRYETIHVCSYTKDSKQEQISSFNGKIIEANKNSIIVEPNEGEEVRKTADKISVVLGKSNDEKYEVGSVVKIVYTGYIMETYPAQIEAVSIEVTPKENFEIRFYDKQPQTDNKIHKILDKAETNKYDYNVYAYNGSVNILIDGKEISLRNALLENKITIDDIIVKANKDLQAKVIKGDIYKDGGSIRYEYPNFTIIKGNTLDDNKDVYIGTKDMTINDIK